MKIKARNIGLKDVEALIVDGQLVLTFEIDDQTIIKEKTGNLNIIEALASYIINNGVKSENLA